MWNTAWLILAVIFGTLVLSGIFADRLLKLELLIVKWFSHVTAQPRWWSVWALMMFFWIAVRHVLRANHLLDDDSDLIWMTILWSVTPAQVEYALKYTAAQQMDHLTQILISVQESQRSTEDLAVSVRDVVERIEQQGNATYALMERVVEALEMDGG